MEKEYCVNNAAMPIPWNGVVNLVNSGLISDSSSYMDQQYYAHLESPLSDDDAFIRELVAKQLGGAAPSPRLPPILDHVGSWGNPPLPPSAAFSCFGSRSFNGRRTVAGGAEFSSRSDQLTAGTAKLPRVSSTPAIEQGGSPPEIRKVEISMGSAKKSSSNEESSVSEMNSKKRKAVVRSSKSNEGEEDGGFKRSKAAAESVKTEQKAPTEPPKDYIHVRARRGQATDSHSLAERVRREKISERMKLLQDLVPGCNKVTGKALMLDEIINYVQSLQRQVEFLSMKLATVNPGLDFNAVSKDAFQENGTLQQQMYRVDNDTSSTAFYHHHHRRQHQSVRPPLLNDADASSVDPAGIQFPSLDGFSEFQAFGGDDLHSIVHMEM